MEFKSSSGKIPDDRDEAALWWATRRLDAGGLSDEEKASLEIWLGASHENRAALEEAEASAECFVCEELFDPKEIEELRTDSSKYAKGSKLLRFAPVWGTAAAAIVLSVVLFWPEKVDSYVAAASEKRELTLEDGTSVLMAPGSLLEIVFNEKIREVRLIKGAAIFDIAPEDRAFLTKAGDYEIRDIGTIFSVEVRSEIAGEELEIAGVEVEVKEGAVEIVNTAVNASQAARVEEGETTVWREPEVTPEVEPFSVERFAEWQNGFLSYRNRSLAEVLADLGRTYGLEIRMEDQTLSEETITGTMPVDDLVDAIGLLETLLPVELRQEGSSLYRVVRVD